MKMIASLPIMALVAMASFAATVADVLVDQPVDHVSFFPSHNWGFVLQVGDDFVLPDSRPVRIDSARFTMVISWPNSPFDYYLEIYRTRENDFWPWNWSPIYGPPDHRTIGPSAVIDHGEWKGGGDNGFGHVLHEVEVVFDDLDIVLEPGVSLDDRWFFSPVGMITDPREMISYWATAGHGDLNWSEGWHRIYPGGGVGWRPISVLPGWEWGPTDFAMRIEGEILETPATNLTGMEVARGTLLDGDLDDLRHSDDSRVHARSGHGDRASLYAMELLVDAATIVENPSLIHITVEGSIDQQEGFVRLLLRNWNTGEFEFIGQRGLFNGEEIRFREADIDAADHVNEEGAIQVMVVYRVGVRPMLSFTFDSFIDYVQIAVE